jgi:flavin reductase (DIM6/NTAB) family NADH-FMN oxidoreductase RutF
MAEASSIPREKSYLLLNHGPVTLITTAAAGRRNVMAASWVMPLDFDPPKIVAVIDRNSYTRQLIDATGEFAINIPCRAQADLVLRAGSSSGRDTDKLAALGLAWRPAMSIGVPLIDGCAGWLECRVITEPHVERAYDLFVAEVVAASADPEVFRDGRWLFADPDRRTLHYVAGGSFLMTGDELVAGCE